jgi:hypothetical protein
VSLQFGSNSFYPKFLKTDRMPRYARQERNQTLGRAKRKGVGGNEFLPALAFPPPPNFVPVKLARRSTSQISKSFWIKNALKTRAFSKNIYT